MSSRPQGSGAPVGPAAAFIAPLDGLRGLAALGVVLYHMKDIGHLRSLLPLQHAFLFVDLFFVLSGFIIFHVYGTRLGSGPDVRTFLVQRLARIYPLHAFALASMLVLTVALAAARDAGLADNPFGARTTARDGAYEFTVSLALLHGMGVLERLVWNTPSWSVSVEFFAYVAFAGLSLTGVLRQRLFTPLAATAVAAGLGFLAMAKPDLDVTTDYAFIRCLCGFTLGVLACRHRAILDRAVAGVPRRWRGIVDALVVAGTIGFLALASGKVSFLAPLAFTALVAWCLGQGGWLVPSLGSRLCQWLGKVSYSAYLIQLPIATVTFGVARHLGLLDADVTADIVAVATLAAILACSDVTYRLVEAPSRSAIRRWWSARHASSGRDAAAPGGGRVAGNQPTPAAMVALEEAKARPAGP